MNLHGGGGAMTELTMLAVILLGGTCVYYLGVEHGRASFREAFLDRTLEAMRDPELLDDPDWPGSPL